MKKVQKRKGKPVNKSENNPVKTGENDPLNRSENNTITDDNQDNTDKITEIKYCPKCKADVVTVKWSDFSHTCGVCGTHITQPPVTTERGYPLYSVSDFTALVEEFRTAEDSLLGLKGDEYGSDTDRLENFHQQALLQGVEPMDIAVTYLLKHVLAIVKMVRERSFEWSWTTELGHEGGKQRVADMRNYGLLLAACIEEFVRQMYPLVLNSLSEDGFSEIGS